MKNKILYTSSFFFLFFFFWERYTSSFDCSFCCKASIVLLYLTSFGAICDDRCHAMHLNTFTLLPLLVSIPTIGMDKNKIDHLFIEHEIDHLFDFIILGKQCGRDRDCHNVWNNLTLKDDCDLWVVTNIAPNTVAFIFPRLS